MNLILAFETQAKITQLGLSFAHIFILLEFIKLFPETKTAAINSE